MGSRMAANLARAGHEVAVYNRTAEKARAFVDEHGGRVAASPRAAAEGAAAVITMVVDGPQVEAMLLGEDGAAAGAAAGHAVHRLHDDRAGRRRADRRRARRARHGLPRRAGLRLLAEGGGRHADDHGRRRAGRLRARAAVLRGDGREDPARRPARARADRQGDLERGRRDERGDARPGARGRQGQRRRPGRARRRARRERGRVDDGDAEGGADGRARLHAAVPARPHAQGHGHRARDRAPPPGRRSRPPRSPASSTSRRSTAGLGDEDFAAVLEAVEGLAGVRL